MATVDTEQLRDSINDLASNLTRVFESRIAQLEQQQAQQHGENKQALSSQTSNIGVLQRQMSALIGEGTLDGRIGTMQREVESLRTEVDEKDRAVNQKLDTMQWKIIGLLAAILTNFVTMIIGYLLTRK